MIRSELEGIDAGSLRHRLTLQRATTSQGPGGKAQVAYATVGTYWASVEPLSGRELFRARQLKATTSHRIRMRDPGIAINPSSRFVFEGTGRVFNVDSDMRHFEIGAWVEIMATELKSPQ